MNWIQIISGGLWIYGALFAVALLVTYRTHARQRARRIKTNRNAFWRDK